jgi:predicted ATPase
LKLESLGDEVTGEIVAMHLSDSRNRVQVAPSDVGFGIGQLLPILVQGIISRAQTVCVEQPEIHLHPRLQACLADFFIGSAGLGGSLHPDRGVQWIIETHSEALMLRLQRRIREQRIKPDDISVLYVWPSPEGTSHIMKLRLDECGDFTDTWPDGFFEESYKEVFA